MSHDNFSHLYVWKTECAVGIKMRQTKGKNEENAKTKWTTRSSVWIASTGSNQADLSSDYEKP